MAYKEDISEYKVNSVQDYITVIESLIDEGFAGGMIKNKLWYRGIYNANYKLLPSIFRTYKNGSVESVYVDCENSINEDFKRNAYPYFQNPPRDDDHKEWLNIIQHHGAPTRLLDWSENYLVALYFAVVDETNIEYEDAAVWVLNPIKYIQTLNSIETNPNRIYKDNYLHAFNRRKDVNMTEYPYVIVPKYLE